MADAVQRTAASCTRKTATSREPSPILIRRLDRIPIALRLRPNYADAFDCRGLVYLKLNRNGNAVSDYDAALRLKPNLASSLYGHGIAKLRSGRSAEANVIWQLPRKLNRASRLTLLVMVLQRAENRSATCGYLAADERS